MLHDLKEIEQKLRSKMFRAKDKQGDVIGDIE